MYKYAIKHHLRDRAVKSPRADARLSSVFHRTATRPKQTETSLHTRRLTIYLRGTILHPTYKGHAILIEQFWGNVVLDIVNMAYRDKDSILDQIYQKQIFSDFYYEDLEY